MRGETLSCLLLTSAVVVALPASVAAQTVEAADAPEPAESASEGAPAPEVEVPVAPARVPAGDVVRLRNGGVLRGTIAELIPGDRVVIVTAAGDRRELPMSEVTYAGPVDGSPTVAPPLRRRTPRGRPRPRGPSPGRTRAREQARRGSGSRQRASRPSRFIAAPAPT